MPAPLTSVPVAQLTGQRIAFRRRCRTEPPRSWLAPPIRPTPPLSSEQTFEQRLPGHTGVLGNVAQDAGQCAGSQGCVTQNGDVMLAALPRGQSKMAAGLTGHPVAQVSEGSGEIVAGDVPAEASRGDDFLAHEVEPDHSGGLPFVEVAANRIPDLVVQVRDAVGFGEDRLPEGPGGEAAFRGFPDEEDEFQRSVPLA